MGIFYRGNYGISFAIIADLYTIIEYNIKDISNKAELYKTC